MSNRTLDSALTVDVVQGEQMVPHLETLAELRIAVFREWPYLYDGDLNNERKYLKHFVEASSSVLVLACAPANTGASGERQIVGVSTAMALTEESPEIRQPFEAAGHDPGDWFYLSESVLLPEFRGRGLGHAFFDARQAAGRRQGFTRFTFCAIERRADDPRRPAAARSLEPFWRKRGYAPSDLRCQLRWKEVGAPSPTLQSLQFWTHGEPELRSHD